MTIKETVLVFSATRHLYETFIHSEVIALSKNYQVVILAENEDIPISDEYHTILFYRPSDIKYLPPLIRAFNALRHYKKMAQDIANLYKIRTIILHTDADINVNVFVEELKKLQAIKVLLRRASMVLYPQNDFKWQSKISNQHVFLQQLILFIKKIYFEIFLATLIHKKPIISRTAFWVTKKKLWVIRRKLIYDQSVCYSEKCQEHLLTIYEKSFVLKSIKINKQKEIKTKSLEQVLFISSNYAMMLSHELNISIVNAEELYRNIVIRLANNFIDAGIKFYIKFKSVDEFEFPDTIKDKIVIIPRSKNLYEYADNFLIIIGVVGTPLWLYANRNHSGEKKIISLRLTNSDYFSYFKDNPNVITVDYNYDFEKDILKKLREESLSRISLNEKPTILKFV